MRDMLGGILQRKCHLNEAEAKKLARETRKKLNLPASLMWTEELEMEAIRIHKEQSQQKLLKQQNKLSVVLIGAIDPDRVKIVPNKDRATNTGISWQPPSKERSVTRVATSSPKSRENSKPKVCSTKNMPVHKSSRMTTIEKTVASPRLEKAAPVANDRSAPQAKHRVAQEDKAPSSPKCIKSRKAQASMVAHKPMRPVVTKLQTPPTSPKTSTKKFVSMREMPAPKCTNTNHQESQPDSVAVISPRRRSNKVPISPTKDVEHRSPFHKKKKKKPMGECIQSLPEESTVVVFDEIEEEAAINAEPVDMVTEEIPDMLPPLVSIDESEAQDMETDELPSMFPPMRSDSYCTVDTLFSGVSNVSQRKLGKWSRLPESPKPEEEAPQMSKVEISVHDSSPKRPVRRNSVDIEFDLPFQEMDFEKPRERGMRRRRSIAV